MTVSGPRRKTQPLDVPDLEEDPAERKRVLNVLAQRRYRRRKKEHLQKLEKTVSKESSEETSTETEQSISPLNFAAAPSPPFPNQWENLQYVNGLDDAQYMAIGLEPMQKEFDDSVGFDPSSLAAFDASFSYPLPSLPASPSLTIGTMTSLDLISQSPVSQSNQFDGSMTFPDEVHLPILELNLLKGAMAIAKRLGVDSVIWSLDANSRFHNSSALTYTHLPVNLRPTRVQLHNPHHPSLDILPWPSVRDKLILVFSQPEEVRPPSARSPTALLDFIYDLEDSAEGVRIWGDDPYTDENWEVGEKLFTNWWWALDRRILNRSNELRRNRGASLLGADKNRHVEEIA